MKHILKTFFISLLCLLLCACNSVGTDSGADNSANSDKAKGEISFTDDDGIEISLDKPAERIISLYSAHTENLYYLGAGDRLIGAYKTSTFPPEAAFLERYDYNGDPETLIAAAPDLVIIRPFVRDKAPDYVRAIENAGITVVSLYPDRFEEFDDYIKKLASLTGTEDRAEELLADFHGEIDRISGLTSSIEPKQSIFFESTDTNVRTVTADSMAGLAIDLAGGINIAGDAQPVSEGSSIAPFGEEKVLINADNIDVYVSQRGSMNSGASKQGISERAGFESVKAIKNDRFYTINEKLISSPSFRYVKGVRELARYLYPEVLDDISAYENDNAATKRSFADIVFLKKHLPVFVPSSSSYYENEYSGHTYGLFEDIPWTDKDFDSIETCVSDGYIEGRKDGDKEYFDPDAPVTRDMLAQTVFVMGDFTSTSDSADIADISESEHPRIVKTLVQNGVFELVDGKFEPKRQVTNNEIIKALEFVK